MERRRSVFKGPITLALDDRVAVAGYVDGTVAVADLLDAAPGGDARAHAAVSFLAKNMWDSDPVPSMSLDDFEEERDDSGDQCAIS